MADVTRVLTKHSDDGAARLVRQGGVFDVGVAAVIWRASGERRAPQGDANHDVEADDERDWGQEKQEGRDLKHNLQGALTGGGSLHKRNRNKVNK